MSQQPMFIEGDRIYFRGLLPSDAEGDYFQWMNDSQVVQFLESRFRPASVEGLRAYIEQMSTSPDNVFCAIVTKHNNKHIGNIKLGPIDWIHRRAEVGLLIGDKEAWGQGFGTEAYKLMADFAFFTLNLHKVTAGAYSENHGSVKALQRAGFKQEGVRRSHAYIDGGYTDLIVFGLLRDDFQREELLQDALAANASESRQK